ncbi:unnamed protein product [Amoebophrya sp. A120]|nr:unnamed protein product [Amoebophrya sp. A120]|eukprot:GSA120T00003348001.1
MVTYKLVFRLKYSFYFGLAACLLLKQFGLIAWSPSSLPVLANLNCTDPLFVATSIVMYVVAGSVLVGAAQLEPYAQKKMMQYTMMTPVAKLGLMIAQYKTWNIVMVLPLLDLLLNNVMCYTKLGEPVEPLDFKVGPKTKKLCRLSYVLLTLYTIAVVFVKPARPEIYGASATASCMAYAQTPLVTVVSALIVAAQCDAATARKTLQYVMTLPLLVLFYLFPLTVATTGKSAMMGGLADVCLYYVLMMLSILVLYPCQLRTAVLRGQYLFYSFAAVVHAFFPAAATVLFGYSAAFPATVNSLMAVFLFLLSLMFIASVLSDPGYSQYKVIQYSLCGDVLLVALFAAGHPLGTLFPFVAGKCVVAKGLDVYYESYKNQSTPKFFGLFVDVAGIAEDDDETLAGAAAAPVSVATSMKMKAASMKKMAMSMKKKA